MKNVEEIQLLIILITYSIGALMKMRATLREIKRVDKVIDQMAFMHHPKWLHE